MRFPGITRYIYLGRGNHYEGIWQNERNFPGPLRLKDRYLDYIRKYLVGARVSEIHCDDRDRIIHIPYYKKGELNLFSLFWKGRSFYFLNIFTNDKQQKEIYTCWKLLKEKLIYDETDKVCDLIRIANNYWNELGRGSVELGDKKNNKQNIEEYFSEELKKTSRKVFPGRKKKFFQRKLMRIEQDLKKVKVWRELTQVIQDKNFNMPSQFKFELCGIKFKATLDWNEFKRKNIIFDKIKKFKKAERILETRLSDCREEFSAWSGGDRYEDVGKGKICNPVWHVSSKKQQKLEVNNDNIQIYEYELEAGIKFAVGKTSQSNDFLRIKWAKKEDYWFHIDGMKSAHLIVKVDSLSQLTPEIMNILGSAMKELSSVDIEIIPLVYTQVKNLKGVKGRPGAVTMKKQKYLSVLYKKEWKEIISRD